MMTKELDTGEASTCDASQNINCMSREELINYLVLNLGDEFDPEEIQGLSDEKVDEFKRLYQSSIENGEETPVTATHLDENEALSEVSCEEEHAQDENQGSKEAICDHNLVSGNEDGIENGDNRLRAEVVDDDTKLEEGEIEEEEDDDIVFVCETTKQVNNPITIVINDDDDENNNEEKEDDDDLFLQFIIKNKMEDELEGNELEIYADDEFEEEIEDENNKLEEGRIDEEGGIFYVAENTMKNNNPLNLIIISNVEEKSRQVISTTNTDGHPPCSQLKFKSHRRRQNSPQDTIISNDSNFDLSPAQQLDFDPGVGFIPWEDSHNEAPNLFGSNEIHGKVKSEISKPISTTETTSSKSRPSLSSSKSTSNEPKLKKKQTTSNSPTTLSSFKDNHNSESKLELMQKKSKDRRKRSRSISSRKTVHSSRSKSRVKKESKQSKIRHHHNSRSTSSKKGTRSRMSRSRSKSRRSRSRHKSRRSSYKPKSRMSRSRSKSRRSRSRSTAARTSKSRHRSTRSISKSSGRRSKGRLKRSRSISANSRKTVHLHSSSGSKTCENKVKTDGKDSKRSTRTSSSSSANCHRDRSKSAEKRSKEKNETRSRSESKTTKSSRKRSKEKGNRSSSSSSLTATTTTTASSRKSCHHRSSSQTKCGGKISENSEKKSKRSPSASSSSLEVDNHDIPSASKSCEEELQGQDNPLKSTTLAQQQPTVVNPKKKAPTSSIIIENRQEATIIFQEKLTLIANGKWTVKLEESWNQMEDEERFFRQSFKDSQESMENELRQNSIYGAEWNRFWKRRYTELVVDDHRSMDFADSYDYSDEWRREWGIITHGILKMKFDQSILQIRKKYGMDLGTLRSLNSNVTESKQAADMSNASDSSQCDFSQLHVNILPPPQDHPSTPQQSPQDLALSSSPIQVVGPNFTSVGTLQHLYPAYDRPPPLYFSVVPVGPERILKPYPSARCDSLTALYIGPPLAFAPRGGGCKPALLPPPVSVSVTGSSFSTSSECPVYPLVDTSIVKRSLE